MLETKEDLRAWMRFGQPLESVLGDFQRVFDVWEAMDVNGIVLDRMYFRDEEHKYHPIFDPNPRVYERLGLSLPNRKRENFRLADGSWTACSPGRKSESGRC